MSARLVKSLFGAVALVLLTLPATAQLRPERTSTTHVLSEADRVLYRRAFDAAARRDWTNAQGFAVQGRDATARRIIQWRFLMDQDSGASFVEIDAFLKNNPEWPSRGTLLSRAEMAMPADMAPAAVVQWFAGREPQTGIGRIRLGHALIATGQVSAGAAFIRSAWAENSLQSDHEAYVIRNHGDLLTPALEAQRLDNLLWRDDNAGAKRQLPRVSDDAQRVGQVRLALRSSPTIGIRLAGALPKRLAQDPGVLFDLARVQRAKGETETAAALLLRIAALENKLWPTKMWPELHITARQAVGEGKYRTAYRLVSDTGLTDGAAFADAEFLAGWIALHFLNDPQSALGHFQKLEAGVSRPISKARAFFWEGRAAEASGDKALAASYYRQGAAFGDTYYGQLAASQLDGGQTLRLNDASIPVSSLRRIEETEMVRAIRVLADLGEERLLRQFAIAAVGPEPDARRASQLSQLMVDLGYPEVALRTAKQVGYSGVLLLTYSFPVIETPPYPGSGAAPETPLVLALIRQETEFDPNAVSSAGALGIMQMMPATAKKVASRNGMAFDQSKLLYDTRYNMQLGMSELQAQLDYWGGSYILAIAAYNAGPGNVRRWITQFGDPRQPGIDPIDWVESISFGETRNYVQRVLENIQVYRNRLAGADQPVRILADIYRPNAPVASVLNYVPPPVRAAPPAPPKASSVPVPQKKPVVKKKKKKRSS